MWTKKTIIKISNGKLTTAEEERGDETDCPISALMTRGKTHSWNFFILFSKIVHFETVLTILVQI